MEAILTVEGLVAFLTLVVLELVLGIDNIIFISIISGRLPLHQQERARKTGLLLAVITRVVLLMSLSWLANLTAPWFTVMNEEISGRDLILIVGGLFLLFKATYEIHAKIEGVDHGGGTSSRRAAGFAGVIFQILILDLVFSIDSVITAIGMAQQVSIMIAAVVVATLFMVGFAGPVSRFVDGRPTIKMLALSFLLLIGCSLVAEGFGHHVPKGYIYFSMAFSAFVEMLNQRLQRKAAAPRIHGLPQGASGFKG